MLLYMYQIFSSLRGHLHFWVHFFFTFMVNFFFDHPISDAFWRSARAYLSLNCLLTLSVMFLLLFSSNSAHFSETRAWRTYQRTKRRTNIPSCRDVRTHSQKQRGHHTRSRPLAGTRNHHRATLTADLSVGWMLLSFCATFLSCLYQGDSCRIEHDLGSLSNFEDTRFKRRDRKEEYCFESDKKSLFSIYSADWK